MRRLRWRLGRWLLRDLLSDRASLNVQVKGAIQLRDPLAAQRLILGALDEGRWAA